MTMLRLTAPQLTPPQVIPHPSRAPKMPDHKTIPLVDPRNSRSINNLGGFTGVCGGGGGGCGLGVFLLFLKHRYYGARVGMYLPSARTLGARNEMPNRNSALVVYASHQHPASCLVAPSEHPGDTVGGGK